MSVHNVPNTSLPIAAPGIQDKPASQVNKVQKRIDILTSEGNDRAVSINTKSVVVLKEISSDKSEAKNQLKNLGQQIAEGEKTLKTITITGQMVAFYQKTGKPPPELSGMPPEVIKLYELAIRNIGKDQAITLDRFKELARTQHDYVDSLRAAHKEVASKVNDFGAVTPESMEKSAAGAKKYLNDPKIKPKFDRILSQLKEGDKITLSRKLLKELGQGDIPHSVLIVKDSKSLSPKGYRLFFTPHDKNIDHTLKFDEKKQLAEGTFNKVSRMGTQEGGRAVNRQPLSKSVKKSIDDVREDKVLQDMKGKSAFVMNPIGSEPEQAVQDSIRDQHLIEGTAFKIVQGQVMERFDADGAKAIDLDSKTLIATNPPSVKNTLSMLDSLTHGYADLHANNIFQLDNKLQNTGVFEIEEEGEKRLIMKLTDFGKAANLDNPTIDENGESEITKIDPGGTILTMSPEQINKAPEANKKLKELLKQKASATTDEQKKAIDDQIKELNYETYSKTDCYAMALTGFVLIAGKFPADLTGKNNFKLTMTIGAMDIKIGPPDENKAGAKLREELTAAAKARVKEGEEPFDDQLIELVLKGFNTDPSKRPSAAEFQEYFQSKVKG